MGAPAAVSGTFADFRLVKSRKIAQIVVEVAIEHADEAIRALGGLPQPHAEKWVALARLNGTPGAVPGQDGEVSPSGRSRGQPAGASPSVSRTPWHEMRPSKQAAMRSRDPRFIRFLADRGDVAWRDQAPDWAAEVIRTECGVGSRRDLDINPAARRAWQQLDMKFMQAAGLIAEVR